MCVEEGVRKAHCRGGVGIPRGGLCTGCALGFVLSECVEVCWAVCVQGGVLGGVLHSDMCGEGVGSSCAASEYGSCRVCMEGRRIEMFRWGVCV